MKSPALPPGSSIHCPRCGKGFRLSVPLEMPPAARPTPPAAKPQPAVANPSPKRPQETKPDARAAYPASEAKPQAEQVRRTVNPTREKTDKQAAEPAKRLTKPAPPPEIAVVCRLCGTRMYAKEAMVGKKIRCPDCTTENLVRPPAKASGAIKQPSLDEAIEFNLDSLAERPKYQPLVVPRGEDEILGELGQINTQATNIEGSLPRPVGNAPSAPNVPPARAANDDDEGDFQLSAAIERPAYEPPVPRYVPEEAPPPPPPPPGMYGDELWGQPIDRSDPQAWKKSPFMVGLVSFLFHPDAIAPWVMQCVATVGIITLGQFAFGLLAGGGFASAIGIPFLALFAMAFTMYGAALSACCLAVVQDTANGSMYVNSWPGLNFIQWFFDALFMPAAAFVAAFPGMALAALMMQDERIPALIAPLLAMCSCLAFFPVVLFSMLEAGTILTPVSRIVLSSLTRSADAWLLYYMYSFGFGLIGGIGITIAAMPNVIAAAIASFILVTLTLIYFRVLGRLMWYCQKNLPADAG